MAYNLDEYEIFNPVFFICFLFLILRIEKECFLCLCWLELSLLLMLVYLMLWHIRKALIPFLLECFLFSMFVYKVSFICTDNIIIHTIMRIKINFRANAKCQKLASPFPPKGVPAGTFGGNKYETSHNGEGTTKRPPPSHGARPTPWFDSGILPAEFGS